VAQSFCSQNIHAQLLLIESENPVTTEVFFIYLFNSLFLNETSFIVWDSFKKTN